jgi:DNA repair exonuclease SbcCD nuclease subunit
MIRILHAADLHLDSPFAALGREQAAQRREEQRQLVRRMGEICRERSCQLLLLAGDLFDSDLVYRETAELLRDVLGSLRARVFIAPGNHDPWSPQSLYATLRWPENVHVFRSRAVEAVRLEDLGVTVYGAAFPDAHCVGLLQGFRADPGDAASVMVLHGTLGDPASPYNPISEAEILESGLDYLALGHIHRQELRRVGGVTVGNPGCAMGRGFDETGPKGALYVELDRGGCRAEPVPLGGRVYETLSVPAGADPRKAIEALLPADTRRDIYRITLTGACPPPDLAALYAALSGRFYALELLDRTLPPPELWRDAEEDSLKGEFLRRLKKVYGEAQTEDARRQAAQAARLGLALMEQREVPEL